MQHFKNNEMEKQKTSNLLFLSGGGFSVHVADLTPTLTL